MKTLLATLLCLLSLTSAHAQAWPRNPTTGKVEFKGTLPWPASAKTEAQQLDVRARLLGGRRRGAGAAAARAGAHGQDEAGRICEVVSEIKKPSGTRRLGFGPLTTGLLREQ